MAHSSNTTLKKQTRNENEELKARLEEAEATLDAIRSGEVDALVGESHRGKQIYTLQSADYSYRILVESMDQGALTLSQDGTILYCNRAFSKMVKTPLERVTGSSITKFIDTKDQARFTERLKKKNKQKNWEFQLVSSDSTAVPIFISVSTLQLDPATKVTSMIITDLTETKHHQEVEAARTLAEQQLAYEREARKRDKELKVITRQRSHLLALNKAKDEFISLASHQLRTPANAVKLYIGMLLDDFAGKLRKDQQELLKTAYASNDRQLKIVDDLLKVAQVDAGNVKLSKIDCDLVKLMKDVVKEQLPKFRAASQSLVFDSSEKELKTQLDVRLIRMALENIVDNAGKYSPHGQTINVRLKKSKTRITINVQDKGVGIGPEDRKKLFRKFSRIDNPLSVLVGGSGLGLYWTKKIIDLHGGSIDVVSKVNEGTTFTVKLPTGH